MLVTFTNASVNPIFLSQIYYNLEPSQGITTRRSTAQLDADYILKQYVVAGTIVLSFTLEPGDSAGLGSGSAPSSYSDATRPAANTVPAFTAIWNTDDNHLNWSDGVNWRDATGVLT
jgi:hypothetical protein